MCAVSVVHDYFRQFQQQINPQRQAQQQINPQPNQWWGEQPPHPNAGGPLPQGLPWTRDTFEEYKEIIRRLGELDRKLAQPECEDPAKAAWMADVERRLALLEGAKS